LNLACTGIAMAGMLQIITDLLAFYLVIKGVEVPRRRRQRHGARDAEGRAEAEAPRSLTGGIGWRRAMR
jgi:hypothetical protein